MWIDVYAKALRQALPAISREAIRVSMETTLGRAVSLAQVDGVLWHLRHDPARFDYTVPQVRAGRSDPTVERFIAIETTNHRKLTSDERLRLYQGAFTTVATELTKMLHLANSLRISTQHLPAGAFHDHIEELEEHASFLQKRTQRMLNSMTA